MDTDRPVVFTVTQVTRNFGGLFDIKTKDPRGSEYNREEQGVMTLYTALEEISQDVNDGGYAVLFEVG